MHHFIFLQHSPPSNNSILQYKITVYAPFLVLQCLDGFSIFFFFVGGNIFVRILLRWQNINTDCLSCVLDCGLDRTGFGSRQRQRIFLFSTMSRPARAALRSMGTWVPSPAWSCPGREGDHTPPSSAGGMNEWSYTFTSRGREQRCFTLPYEEGVLLSYNWHFLLQLTSSCVDTQVILSAVNSNTEATGET